MAKEKRGRKARKGASRLHIILSNQVLARVKREAKRDGQSLSIKIERILDGGMTA